MLCGGHRSFVIAAVFAGAWSCAGGGAPEAPATPASVAASSSPQDNAASAKHSTEDLTLERRVAAMPKDSPDRPALLRQLAKKYVALEDASQKAVVEAVAKRDAAAAKRHEEAAASAREQAIKYYTLLMDQHPDYCQKMSAQDPAGGSGCTDEVLYYFAYEYDQAKRFDDAQRAYLELLERFPASKLVPRVWLGLAEEAFWEAENHPSQWRVAKNAYLEVTHYPPPDNEVWGYAQYRLAYVYWKTNDFARALVAMTRTIEYGMQYPSLSTSSLPTSVPHKFRSASRLAEAARRDMIPIFAIAGDPGKAFDFFQRLSGDGDGEQQKTITMMNELGQIYLNGPRVAPFRPGGSNKEAAIVYIDLIRRSKGALPCAYFAQLDAATAKLKPEDDAAIRRTLVEHRARIERSRAGCTP